MVCLHRQKFHTPNLYTMYDVRVCNGIYVFVAMSQRVGRRAEGRVGETFIFSAIEVIVSTYFSTIA